jgi:hypothetical protein
MRLARSVRLRRLPPKLKIAGLTGFVVVLLIGAVMLEDRLGPIDPTDPGWKAEVTNDLGVPIHVKSSAVDLTVAPGTSEIFGSPRPGQLNFRLTITNQQGQTLGCLAVRGDKEKTIQLKASQMTICGT